MARGSIQERVNKDGTTSYIAVIAYKDINTGKWRHIWKSAPSIRKAEALKTKLLAEVSGGNYTAPTKLTLEKYLLEWQAGLPGPVGDRTCELYEYMSRLHIIPELGKIPLTQLRATQIQRLYSIKLTSGLSPRTVQLIHVTLHKALKAAVKTGLLTTNPCDNATQAKPEKKDMRILHKDEIGRFLEEAKKGPYYCLFHCYLFTGVRRSELLALRWIDLDLLGMTMSINRQMKFIKRVVSYKTPKTKSGRRMLDLSPESCQVLRDHREYQERIRRESGLPPVQDTDLVFCRFDNSPYLPDGVTHSWTKLVKRCGYDVTLHGARHSNASLLLKAGVSPKVIQERLGHASISTTLNLYAHVVPGMGKAAALAFEDTVRNKVSEGNSLDSR